MSPSRILVTDMQDRPGIAAARCLHDSGYVVTGTGLSRGAPGLWSRRCSSRHVVPDVHVGVDGYVTALERVVSEQQHELLLPGTDETLHAVSSRRERLAPHVGLGLPAHEVVERALSKVCLAT